MANIIMRTLILFIALLIMMRLMGKRQIGQLQPYEFALTLIAADLATTPMSDINTPLLWGILPIYVLLIAGVALSLLSLKSVKMRRLICGKPRMLIERGVILEDSLRAVRYTINDLLEQLRSKDIFDVAQVYYAVLETNGEISIIQKSAFRRMVRRDHPQHDVRRQRHGRPFCRAVMDGTIQKENLVFIQKSEQWLKKNIEKAGFRNEKEILLLTYDKEKFYIHGAGKDPVIKEEPCGT